MSQPLSTALTPANRARALELLAASPPRLAALSQPLAAARLRQPLGPGERSLTECLAHLVNTEARSSDAIYLALLADEPLLPALHPERDWGRLLRYDLCDFAALLGYFTLRRKVLLRVLVGLSEAQWARTVLEAGKQRRESVYWRARALALHEQEHLNDLARKL